MMPSVVRARAAVLLLPTLLACTLLTGCNGWGVAISSVFDRLFMPEETVWAHAPKPESYTETYTDATGTGTNYVYRVQGATADGTPAEITIIWYGRKAPGDGWLEIEAHGRTGDHYRSVDASDVPDAVMDVLEENP
ncbi:hypothetical protein [Enorma phocaeensis]|uniref:DUF1093 domain-containing protein n=1 Tax=Enorma phocaeensis TaxID=1871019 RepID=A0A921IUF0_9ACTN|nr:hypothetical protein [Enorma phocaeensis]HJG37791.1 hypothetical protein [Enorma phocaeensis]